ncbi:hypothetical protein LPJ66_012180, partial [Kickxella alabastrina]
KHASPVPERCALDIDSSAMPGQLCVPDRREAQRARDRGRQHKGGTAQPAGCEPQRERAGSDRGQHQL